MTNPMAEQMQARDQKIRLLEVEVSTLKDEYQNAIATLEQIENAQSPTNAQVIAAVKFLAKTMRLLLRLLARQFA